jgi:hypothetical protein
MARWKLFKAWARGNLYILVTAEKRADIRRYGAVKLTNERDLGGMVDSRGWREAGRLRWRL